MMDPLWTLDRVTLHGRGRPRLDAVTLTIPRGVTAVIGYSGAGKTSLLNVLVGFERVDRGTVVRHSEQTEMSVPPKSLPLFWVPQNDGLWPHLTALEHLKAVTPESLPPARRSVLLPSFRRGAAEEGARDCHSLLAAFDLAHRADSRPDQLSQGERARLSVARAIASHAAVLVMDEPLAPVDPARVGNYWNVLSKHCRATDTSLIIATHSPEIVLREAERVVCLSDGRVTFQGTVEELYYHPPTAELATMLGPANWIEAAEEWRLPASVGQCLSLPHAEPPSRPEAGLSLPYCLRPEQLAVLPEETGPFQVESARFAGSVAEVELVNERNDRRRFYHRPSGDTLQPGMRVALRVLMLMLFGFVIGCTSEDERQLSVESLSYRTLPPDGQRFPAPRGLTVSPEQELYVLDNAGRVLVYDPDGNLSRQWRMPEFDVGKPEGICILQDGRVAVADTHYHRLVFFDREGTVLGMQGRLGTGPGEFTYPVDITRDDRGNI